MITDGKKLLICAFLSITFALAGCMNSPITLTDAKTATGIDEKLMPTKATDIFPSGTTKVFCWFQWKGAQVGTKIIARWDFVTDDIHILDYEFVIPRKEGWGSVSLSMPEGKTLPPGLYKADLLLGGRKSKSLTFKVE